MSHPVIQMIEEIYRAREQIAQCYDDRAIVVDDAELGLIDPLIKSYLMRRNGGNEFRLSSRFKALFDLPLLREKILVVNKDLGDEVSALELAMLQLNEPNATYEARVERLGEVEDIIISIHDLLEETATRIQTRLNSNFGLLSSSKAKQAENKSYLSVLDNLITSYTDTIGRLRDVPFSDDQDVAGYVRNLGAKTIPIVEKIKHCQNIIREFLYKQREIELKARRVRGVMTQLKKSPGFFNDLPLALAQCDTKAIFYKAEPGVLLAYPDITDRQRREEMADLVVDIQIRSNLKTEKTTTEKAKGHLDVTEMIYSPQEMPACMVAIFALLEHVYSGREEVSLKQYYLEGRVPEAISIDELFFEVTAYLRTKPTIEGQAVLSLIDYRLELRDHEIFTGNKWLEDIVLNVTDSVIAHDD